MFSESKKLQFILAPLSKGFLLQDLFEVGFITVVLGKCKKEGPIHECLHMDILMI